MRGKAKLGDKTMVDALFPVVNALKQATKENLPLRQALIQLAEAAKMGMEQTDSIDGAKGNTGYLREHSAGLMSPSENFGQKGGAQAHFIRFEATLQSGPRFCSRLASCKERLERR